MTAKMELPGSFTCWAHLVPPWLEQGMVAKGPEVAFLTETSGVLGAAHCLLRGPSPLSPAQGRQPCPLMPGCPFVPGRVPVDGAHVTQVDLGSGQALE